MIMKNILTAGVMSALMLAAGCVHAAQGPVYTCAPDGFTLTAVEGGVHLTGQLETPTPGYSAVYAPETRSIRVVAPEGIAVQVISSVTIDLVLPAEVMRSDDSLDITLEKSYDWGISGVTCAAAPPVAPVK